MEARIFLVTGLEFWKKLWRMKVPPKARNFWWRVIKGFIPCRAVLKGRHIEKVGFCHECGREETIKYSLFECTWAKNFWHDIKVATSVKMPNLHPTTWAIDLIDSYKIEQKVASVILCGGWAIWSERNARKHGECTRSVAESVKWTIDIAMDLAITGHRSSNTCPKVRAKWRPPVVGVSRLNVDAIFMIASGEGASGLVLRNHDEALIRGQAIWYNHVSNALVMETIAVRDGVQLASALGVTPSRGGDGFKRSSKAVEWLSQWQIGS